MAARPRFYSRHIASGSGILFFSIFFAAIIRTLYFMNFGVNQASSEDSLLWRYLTPLFENPYISFVCNTILVGVLAFLASLIDTKHLLIRQKTYLPASFIILLFSIHPSFIGMSGEFISAFMAIAMLSMLFSSYNTYKKQHATFEISFVLAIAGLFSTAFLFYLPVLWISLAIMRSFNFRASLASLLGIFIVYFPVCSYFLLTDSLNVFMAPIDRIYTLTLNPLPLLNYEIKEWIILGFSLLLLLITIIDNYLNRHKDKIRVRNYFNLLMLLSIVALISFVLISINPTLHLFIGLIAGAFILSHFFALVESKAGSILFYIFLLSYIVISFSPFFSFS